MGSPKNTSPQPKVLHVTFNMGIGGTEQVIRQLVLGSRGQEVEHEIVCIDGQVGAIGEQMREDGIPVHRISRAPGFDWKLIRGLRNLIRAQDVSIVHCHQYTPFLYGRLAALRTGAKVVFTEHGRFYPDRYRCKAALINPLLALLTPAIVAISGATRDALAKYEFMPKSKIQVIYNGIQPLKANPARISELRSELGIPEDSFVYGTVSRLDPVKNQTMMLQSFARCLKDYPESYLLMVGDGPERQALEALAASLGLSEKVCFTGFINEPAQHLALMDAFLLSSHTEGTSMTLLEAMSLGLPAVVTAVGGNVEVVEHELSGLIAPDSDTAAFAKEMVRLQQQTTLREKISEAARDRFQSRFSAEAMVKSYLRIYYQLLS
ncbi:glycosyltransferase [Marinobacter vinifirmus]|uniref:Glycosyltransferase n=1 Tax=Marinobacter vinifirmus TaxID=355591 RepID=A0A7Z1DWH9_9GAMM|nr:glycosyltransferase [Marinobacter vinifirmus]OZC37245.1 glycosyltransferase [Marinobacter vinifirmus]